jgi:hypothetical protein
VYYKNLIIHGDVNVNCLQESDKKSQLNAILISYNLFSIVQFLPELAEIPFQPLIAFLLIPLR